MGPVDLRICSVVYSYQQRFTVLLRNVRPIQRSNQALQLTSGLLEVLHVLGESGDLLRWWRSCGHASQPTCAMHNAGDSTI